MLPAPASGRREFTADDLRAELLINLAHRLRTTDLTDIAYWRLTTELRHEAETGTPVPQEGEAHEQTEPSAHPEEWARVLREVADQITAYRTEGPAAASRLDPEVLARARTRLAPPPSAHLAEHGGTATTEEP